MIERVVIVVTQSITWKVLDGLLQQESICDVDRLTTAHLWPCDETHIVYVTLTAETKTLARMLRFMASDGERLTAGEDSREKSAG
jgi:hypothetical protein